MNQLIEEAEAAKKTEEPKLSNTGAQMARVAEFDFFLTRENVRRMIPMLMFAAALAIGYIANSHYAEKTIRKTDKLSKEIKELRSEYISIKSDLMFRSKQSEVARRLQEKGIRELTSPPQKITVKAEE